MLSAAATHAVLAGPSAPAARADSHAACRVVAGQDRFDYPLVRVSRRLETDRSIKIVAIGSSSTAGAGAATAKEQNVDLFRRFALMKRWYQSDHLPFDAFVSPDGLHMNDWSYDCLAKWLGTAIEEAASRSQAGLSITLGIPCGEIASGSEP
jgi:hypothetical protein